MIKLSLWNSGTSDHNVVKLFYKPDPVILLLLERENHPNLKTLRTALESSLS